MKRNSVIEGLSAGLAYFTGIALFDRLHVPLADGLPSVLLFGFGIFGALGVYRFLFDLLLHRKHRSGSDPLSPPVS